MDWGTEARKEGRADGKEVGTNIRRTTLLGKGRKDQERKGLYLGTYRIFNLCAYVAFIRLHTS